MKMVALKHISNRLPKGAIFDEGNRARVRMLVHLKLAAPHTEQPPPAAPVTTPPADDTAPTPAPTLDPKAPSRRSTRVGAHAFTPRNG